MNGFTLAYDGFDSGTEGLREALTSTGNGYLCTRGAAEWEDTDGAHYPGTYAHGGYNRETTILGGVPVLNEDLVNLPNWLVLKLRIEGEDMQQTSHPKIRIWKNIPLDRAQLRASIVRLFEAAGQQDDRRLMSEIKKLVPEYTPGNES